MSSNKDDNQTPDRAFHSQPEFPIVKATPAKVALDKNFRNAVVSLRRDLVRTIYYLRVIFDRKVYRMLGYPNIRGYAAEVGGLTERQCKAFLRIGAKLMALPEMKQALEEGAITWRKANVIVGQADPENDRDLVDLAKQLSEDQLRLAIAAPKRSQGRNSPSSPPPLDLPRTEIRPVKKILLPPRTVPEKQVEPENTPCYVNFKFTPEQYAIWAKLGHSNIQTKESVFIEALKNRPTDHPEHGSTDSGYLIVLQECPTCGQGMLSNNRGTFAAPKSLLEAAQCDSVIEDPDANRRRVIPPRLRRQVLKRDGYRCQNPRCSNTQHLQIHHRLPAAQGGGPTLENLITLCGRCHRALHDEEIHLRKANRESS